MASNTRHKEVRFWILVMIDGFYKLFTFLSVDMEILTPWTSQVHPEAQPKGVQATEGC